MNDDDLSFIMGSIRRQDVLLALSQSKMTVGQLSNVTNINPNMLYRIVRELTERGLLAHNDVSRYKIYRTTDQGIELLESIGVIK